MEEEYLEKPIIQIPEQIIRASADSIIEGYNPFTKILEAGGKFKEAGMTPIYLYDLQTMNISLITLETWGKLLH